jgi:hypothetical protein
MRQRSPAAAKSSGGDGVGNDGLGGMQKKKE